MTKLICKNLSCGYDDKVIIDSIDFEIKDGDFIAILGPNGSGKSTFLKTLTRSIKRLKGEILLDGIDISKYKGQDIAKKVASLPQILVAPRDITVENLVAYGRTPYASILKKDIDRDRLNKWAMKETNLMDLKNRFVDTLSGGERQRAWIAMCLCQNTNIILLDEPTTAMDIKYQNEVLGTLKRLNEDHNIAMVIVMHDINQAIRYAKNVALFKEGKLMAYGKPEETLNKEIMKEVFEVEGEFIDYKKHNKKYFIAD